MVGVQHWQDSSWYNFASKRRNDKIQATAMQQPIAIALPTDDLRAFCVRWRISELALFGSALRPDFRPDSDFDLLATFNAGATWGLLDHAQMQHELADLLGRPVDLVSRRAVEGSANPLRRRAILDSALVIVRRGGDDDNRA
jgi:predicted nucleotidyltransferase